MRSIDDAPEELLGPIKEFFPTEEWDHAASIAWLESGWNWAALDDSTQGGITPCGTAIASVNGVQVVAERSIGYFQINSCNFPSWNPAHLYNVRQNVGTAHALWAERGWEPWHFSAAALGLLG